ncbi:MAG: amidase [Caulobacter sp.]|nr:amidase [Caulobacter sp.]
MRRLLPLAAVLTLAVPAAALTPPPALDVANLSMTELRAKVDREGASYAAITLAYLDRIKRLDPKLRSVLAVNPNAQGQAAKADLLGGMDRGARDYRKPQGPLFGMPILIKDNIETLDPMATTAGSLALAGNVTGRDAPVIARLRAAGVVILGKANLSEWANIRSDDSLSGWSAVGGQARNPYDLTRSACGSSAGSAVAVAAGLAAAAVGTETDGSITCPASVNGLVGLKPTVGLISRRYIVPISETQDTAGPMTRTVTDAANMLTVMAGSDPGDAATAEADARRSDYAAALRPDALKGVRVGVMRYAAGFHGGTDKAFEAALAALTAQGAILVEITEFPNRREIGPNELALLMTELKVGMNAYLASTDPLKVPTRTLAEVIAFNTANAGREMPLFGQDLFERAQKTTGLDDPAYIKARDTARRLAGPEGIDALLAKHDVAVLVGPTLGPAWLIDEVLKDRYVGGGAGNAAAVAGYPHLTVPMGLVQGLPVGLSFVGPRWSEARLLAYGFAYEQATKARRAPAL